MVDQLPAAVVGVHRDQDAALRVRGPSAGGFPAESSEDDRMDDAEPSAGEHCDRKLGHERHVDRHPVAGFQTRKITEKGSELVHPSVELVIGEGDRLVLLQFRDEDDGGLVAVELEMPVDAVVAGVELSADEPLVVRGVARVEGLGPILVPGQHVAPLPEALREVLEREALVHRGVGEVRLADELRFRIEGTPLPSSAPRSRLPTARSWIPCPRFPM